MSVAILFDSPWPIGGTITYALHLARMSGLTVIKPGKSWRSGPPLYGVVPVTIMPWSDILALHDALIVPVPGEKYPKEMYAKTIGVLHDADEFRKFPRHWDLMKRYYINRIASQQFLTNKNSPRVPHPYERAPFGGNLLKVWIAVSHCQFNGPKHGLWLLEANAKLPDSKHIQIVGAPHRTWIHFAVKPKFPDFVDYKPFPKEFRAGVSLARTGLLNIDLTEFKSGDGGDVSYSILEAMDAGAIPVMSRGWCAAPGRAKTFGFQVGSADDLVRLLKRKHTFDLHYKQREHNYKILEGHAYKNVIPIFNEVLRRLA